ncbi:MAG: hypothetical protein CUN57_01000, partial [Phototrophicales bacterium]
MAQILLSDSTIVSFADPFGHVQPDIELIRYDDTWRPLIDASAPAQTNPIEWTGRWGAPHPYGHPPHVWIKPLDFDVWGDPNTLVDHNPMDFRGRVTTTPV